MTTNKELAVPVDQIARSIVMLRGQKVLLDAELAQLYGVTTKRFNEQVRRNLERFPADFMFQLTQAEWEGLRSQIATLKAGRGQHRKYLPYAFTEHGAIMAATILNTPLAVEVSVYVVRAFVRLREVLSNNKELAKKLNALEHKVETHDEAIAAILSALRELMASSPEPKPTKKRQIGFVTDD